MPERITRTGIFFLIAVFTVLGIACKKEEPIYSGPVIAEVGKTTLTLDQALENIPVQLIREDSTGALDTYKRQWIRKRVLADEAVRSGITETPEFKKKLSQLTDELAVQMLMDNYSASYYDDEVTIDEAIEYYAINRDNFILKERHVRFHHLFSDTIDDANRARNELLRGENWEEIVERYATDKSYSLRNSDIFHPIGQALSENESMSQFLRVIGVTEISPIRRVNNRYHFVQLMEDRKAGEPPNTDWAFSRIKEWLEIERKQKHIRSFEQNLLRRAEANREIKIID